VTIKNFVVKNGLTTGNILLSAGNSNITANYVIGNLSVPATANLGAVGNITITGGSSGQYLQTNGSGVLSWQTIASSSYSNSNVAAYLPTYTGNISAGNASLGNLVTANFFGGNGSLLTSLTGANVTGQVGYAATANSVAGGNVSGAVGLATYATTANSVAGANVSGQVSNSLISGTVYTNAQPNITSVGSLTGLTVSNATGVVNFTTTANVTLGSISNLHISGGASDYVLKTDGAGNLSWTAQTGGGGGATGVAVGTVQVFTADGSANTYTLSITPSNSSQLLINIDGVVQLHSSYTLSGNTVTLLGTPTSGAKVEITNFNSGGAAGSNTQIQFNDGSNIAGSAALTFDKTSNTLNATNITANGAAVATTGKAIAMAIVFGF
jgi:hypothetical protein